MSAKRARTTKKDLNCYVVDPKKFPGYAFMHSIYDAAAKQALTKYVFNDKDPPFWHLWARIPDKMLYKKGESVPFTDFEAPLAQMTECVFIQHDWAPEYEHLRAPLQCYQHKSSIRVANLALSRLCKELRELQRKVEEKNEELIAMEEHRATCETLLKAAESRP